MIWVLCFFSLLLSSCGPKPQERQYNEIVIEAAGHTLAWVTPDGWTQEAGSAMRLATFHPIANPHAFDCYIVSLAGPVGGLDANLERWLGQLGLSPSDDNLGILSRTAQRLKSKDGLEVTVFDFTTLQAHNDLSDKSMLAAMIALDQSTVFVKMTGPIKSMEKNKDDFLKLLRSITRQ